MIKTTLYEIRELAMGVHDRDWYRDWWRKRLEHEEKAAFRVPLGGRATDEGAELGGEYLERRGVGVTLSRWWAAYQRFLDSTWGVIFLLFCSVYVVARLLRWWFS